MKPRNQEAYRLWFEFLKRSNYSTESPVYKDFGDVRGVTFKEWFEKKQHLFFSVREEPVVLLALSASGLQKYFTDDEYLDYVVLIVNTAQPEKVIMRHVRNSVRIHRRLSVKAARKKGRPKWTRRVGGYSFYRQPHIPSLQTTLDVEGLLAAEPHLKLWQIGERLKLNKDQITKPTDTRKEASDKRAVMTAYVSRYLRWAKALKKNAVNGVFPKTS